MTITRRLHSEFKYDKDVSMRIRGISLALFLASVDLTATELAPLPTFEHNVSRPRIMAPCVAREPWTVAGEHGALLGRQNGVFEAWQWPVKILSGFRINAQLAATLATQPKHNVHTDAR